MPMLSLHGGSHQPLSTVHEESKRYTSSVKSNGKMKHSNNTLPTKSNNWPEIVEKGTSVICIDPQDIKKTFGTSQNCSKPALDISSVQNSTRKSTDDSNLEKCTPNSNTSGNNKQVKKLNFKNTAKGNVNSPTRKIPVPKPNNTNKETKCDMPKISSSTNHTLEIFKMKKKSSTPKSSDNLQTSNSSSLDLRVSPRVFERSTQIPVAFNAHGPGGTAPKKSFVSMGRRVSTLLKMKRGLFPRRIAGDVKTPSPPPEPLPTKPRFSAFMSAEAQFALLKGYEDVLAKRLSDQLPIQGEQLKRNKTPHYSIAIAEKAVQASPRGHGGLGNGRVGLLARLSQARNVGTIKGDDTNIENEDDVSADQNSLREFQNCDGERNEDQKNIPGCSNTTFSIMTQYGPNTSNDFGEEVESLPPITPRRRGKSFSVDTTPCPAIPNRALTNLGSDLLSFQQMKTNPMTRRFSSVSDVGSPRRVIPRDRLLVMTHRLEKAMDILDKLRPETEFSLSPRVMCPSVVPKLQHQLSREQQKESGDDHDDRARTETGQSEPLQDFNRWARQWTLEFTAQPSN